MENGFFSTPGMMPWIKADCRSCSRSALPWRPDAIAKGIARFESPELHQEPRASDCGLFISKILRRYRVGAVRAGSYERPKWAGRGPSTAAGEVPLPTPQHAFIVAQADRRDGRTRRSTTAQIVVEGCALAVLMLENG